MRYWIAQQAVKTAKESDYPHFRHGAVIACGSRILKKKSNIRKSHTPVASMSVHAEVAALKPLMSKTRLMTNKPLADLYVARVTPNGRLALSKPCEKCLKAIRKSGIVRSVFYSNNHGTWTEMEIQ